MSERRGFILAAGGATLFGAALLSGCGGESKTQVSPTIPGSFPTAENTITITPGIGPTLVPGALTPKVEATAILSRTPISGSPTVESSANQKLETIFNSGNNALSNDALIVNSAGINFANNFRVDAEVNLSRGFLAGQGDTLISKGNGFAVYLRSARCVGNVGALIDGKDDCTDKMLKANQNYKVSFIYDGVNVTYLIDEVEVKKTPKKRFPASQQRCNNYWKTGRSSSRTYEWFYS
ncbi:MAG TPA: hypothetical protein VLE91_01720 [Candidatus Saccharimonadales bacterium]|nr:hypothetical protein [Candidatus Saccharimonadales bacterium]